MNRLPLKGNNLDLTNLVTGNKDYFRSSCDGKNHSTERPLILPHHNQQVIVSDVISMCKELRRKT